MTWQSKVVVSSLEVVVTPYIKYYFVIYSSLYFLLDNP